MVEGTNAFGEQPASGVVALLFQESVVGKSLAETKVLYSWTLSLEGRKHTVQFTNSKTSAKKRIFIDGILHYEQKVFRSSNFQYSWPFGSHLFSIVHSHGPSSYELRIDGEPFEHFATADTRLSRRRRQRSHQSHSRDRADVHRLRRPSLDRPRALRVFQRQQQPQEDSFSQHRLRDRSASSSSSEGDVLFGKMLNDGHKKPMTPRLHMMRKASSGFFNRGNSKEKLAISGDSSPTDSVDLNVDTPTGPRSLFGKLKDTALPKRVIPGAGNIFMRTGKSEYDSFDVRDDNDFDNNLSSASASTKVCDFRDVEAALRAADTPADADHVSTQMLQQPRGKSAGDHRKPKHSSSKARIASGDFPDFPFSAPAPSVNSQQAFIKKSRSCDFPNFPEDASFPRSSPWSADPWRDAGPGAYEEVVKGGAVVHHSPVGVDPWSSMVPGHLVACTSTQPKDSWPTLELALDAVRTLRAREADIACTRVALQMSLPAGGARRVPAAQPSLLHQASSQVRTTSSGTAHQAPRQSLEMLQQGQFDAYPWGSPAGWQTGVAPMSYDWPQPTLSRVATRLEGYAQYDRHRPISTPHKQEEKQPEPLYAELDEEVERDESS